MPTITGTAGADTLVGTETADLIDGQGGDDVIRVGGFATTGDTMLGGAGDDRFLWGQGEAGFAFTVMDGGDGADTLDFTGHEGGNYFRSRDIVLQDGALPNTIEGRVTGSNGLLSPSLDQTFMEGRSIERIVGSDIRIELDGFTRSLDVLSLGGGRIWTGAGDDTIALVTRVREGFGGSVFRTLYSSEIDGGAGTDRLGLEKAAADYLFVQTASGWSIYDGRSAVHQVRNVEQVTFAGGAATSFEQAAAIDFDSAAYLSNYADLRAAFGSDELKAFQHYQQYGKSEGRVATVFDGLAYVASYADLVRAIGADQAAAIAHYTRYGAAEGRTITFDGAAYAATHLDLARIIGTDATAAARHYITYGLNEGRAVGGFDSVAYLLSNPDLGQAFSAAGVPRSQVLEAARMHWLTYGADEGRPGDALFGRDQINPKLAFLPFSGPSVTNGQFGVAGDRDWFFADLPTRTLITLNGSDTVSSIAVYDTRGRLIVFDADGRDVGFAVPLETSTAAAGSVYIVATSSGVGAFTITASRPVSQTSTMAEDDAGLIGASNALAGGAGSDPFSGQTAVDPWHLQTDVHHRDPALLDF